MEAATGPRVLTAALGPMIRPQCDQMRLLGRHTTERLVCRDMTLKFSDLSRTMTIDLPTKIRSTNLVLCRPQYIGEHFLDMTYGNNSNDVDNDYGNCRLM